MGITAIGISCDKTELKLKWVNKLMRMIVLPETYILWNKSLHDFHSICAQFNDYVKKKGSKIFEYENTRTSVKYCNN